jgi:hypothetical protein
LALKLTQAIKAFGGPATIQIAERDRIAQVFLAALDTRLRRCPQASHS